ncbi:MAG TPA: acetyl-CoA carboxylase biotin carboxyl carrier protein subunit, partial [Solirubrobacteraceae bacterium]|nr:acetyl-CoA carboxylase biotin carboxyl carrier protein subunit [Solirubrobacteraceae bacterium]
MSSSPDIAVTAPFAGVVVSLAYEAEQLVGAGTAVLVLEAMKMEHEVLAETGGVVRRIEVAVGDAVEEGQTLLVMSVTGEAQADAAVRTSE